MKTLIIMTLSSVILLSGCMNQFKFRANEVNPTTPAPENEATRNPTNDPDIGSPKPEDPVIVDPDRPDYAPVVYKKGECTKDKLDLVPCLSCEVTMRPIDIPLSKKAAQLAQIMEKGCTIANKSDPKGYQPPSRDDIMKFLNRGTDKNYPNSVPTARQVFHLNKWLENDRDYLSRLFGGLWFHPPYSEDFETYFGVEPKEARYFFCYGAPAGSFSMETVTPIYSIGYFQCIQDHSPSSCREKKEYIIANDYRKQLAETINKSVNDPFNDEELIPKNKCLWETMTGNYNLEMDLMVKEWKNRGYEMAVYFDSQNPRCEKATDAIPLSAKVTIAGKLCEDF